MIRQRLSQIDTLYQYPLPEVGAVAQSLETAERSLGFSLDGQYRDFLTHADGWHGFLQRIDLFGTRELAGGGSMKAAPAQLAAVAPEDFENAVGVPLGDLYTVGASLSQSDMWLQGKPGTSTEGRVIWFWGSDFEWYPDFSEFFLAMLDYLRLELKRAEAEG
jgi:hypothetical protein